MRRVGCLILLVVLAAVALVGFNFVRGWTAQGPLAQEATFVVPDGATLRSTARQLQDIGAIGSAESFLNRARLLGSDAPIKAGEYALPKDVSNSEILAILQGGKTVNHFVVIPEGLPSILVYERLMANKELAGPVPIPVEGSVLPDSYAYKKGETRVAVLARMQKAMSDYLARAWEKRSKDIVVKTAQQAITLASIVEKETGVAAERPIVAGVYQNRLRTGMMLQADPTIIYPITKGKPLGRRIKRSEIVAVNDYNTYAMTGLPTGPIANPGRSSIDAVLNPAETKALYFVADGKGGHIFANTLEEHNRNVREWFAIRRARGEM